MSEDLQFSNMDSWRGSGGGGKFGLTFKQIILMHIQRCVVNGSLEMRGGYFQEKQLGHVLDFSLSALLLTQSIFTYLLS